MLHDGRVKGHLALLHEGEEDVGEHDQRLLQSRVGFLGHLRPRPLLPLTPTTLARFCRLSTIAAVEEGQGDREGKVWQL